jgi:hypothetical protein
MMGNDLTPANLSQAEFEAFNMVYALAVLRQLILDKLLCCPSTPIIASKGYETLYAWAEIYPMPTYKDLAYYAYTILKHENKKLSFTEMNLEKLLEDVQANNGYIL